jgi:hypothetical protein
MASTNFDYITIGVDTVIFTNAGAPTTQGAGFAGKGSMCSDVTNGNLYINAGTKAVPSWKLVTKAV